MTLDDVKTFLVGPNGPWVVLVALALLFSVPRYPNRPQNLFSGGFFRTGRYRHGRASHHSWQSSRRGGRLLTWVGSASTDRGPLGPIRIGKPAGESAHKPASTPLVTTRPTHQQLFVNHGGPMHGRATGRRSICLDCTAASGL